MKFVDLHNEYLYFKDKITANTETVLNSGRYLLGQQMNNLEDYFKKLSGKYSAIAVKNCTDAIMLVLRYVYKDGMPIILPNFGAYPTAVACYNYTNNIHYVDVDDSYTIDIKKLPASITGGIIIAVNLFGNNCNMQDIMAYAKANNHIVIEDCAQSTGSGSGIFGDYSVFSFYPTKPLASMGDGGMICTNNEDDAFKILRFYGQHKNKIIKIGVNSRMDELQCAIVNAKIPGYIDLTVRRTQIANRYKQIVNGIKINSNCVYHQFVVKFNEREFIESKLKLATIPYMIHYPFHVSEMDALKGVYNYVAFRINNKVISLPCHPFMTEVEINKVEHFLEEFKQYEVI